MGDARAMAVVAQDGKGTSLSHGNSTEKDIYPGFQSTIPENCENGQVAMKFAKIVFWIAGIWGVLIITPLYFLFDTIGQKDPPPITHPGFFYGFVGVTLAWQIVFLFMATDPLRYRPLIIPSLFEKLSWVAAVITLVSQGRMRQSDLVFAGTDSLLAVLFVIAYLKTTDRKS